MNGLMGGALYLVGTPIGNLGDWSPRARETLAAVDFIAAEDTRVTLKLLNHFEIKRPLVSYHEHNLRERGAQILERLRAGETAALVTDAGMPAISDPGEDLVRQCREAGIPVIAVPGPSAAVTALALSGLPSGRFCFEGFLSMNRNSRRAHLESLRGETRTMLFYEAPHKLAATLRDLLDAFGDRELALVRELTKLHEETERTTLAQAAARYAETPPKGEIVLVVRGAEPEKAPPASPEEAAALARTYLAQGVPAAQAAKRAAQACGLHKAEVYRLLVADDSAREER